MLIIILLNLKKDFKVSTFNVRNLIIYYFSMVLDLNFSWNYFGILNIFSVDYFFIWSICSVFVFKKVFWRLFGFVCLLGLLCLRCCSILVWLSSSGGLFCCWFLFRCVFLFFGLVVLWCWERCRCCWLRLLVSSSLD